MRVWSRVWLEGLCAQRWWQEEWAAASPGSLGCLRSFDLKTCGFSLLLSGEEAVMKWPICGWPRLRRSG